MLLLAIQLTLLMILAMYGAHRLQLLWWRYCSAPPRIPTSAEQFPRVTVQLPIYNERTVITALIEAVLSLDWPTDKLDIQILDDSTDETSSICAELQQRFQQLAHCKRDNRTDYKAGALQAAFASSAEFIAIFDSDFRPQADFLRQLMPHFTDPKVGMVQARWGHSNRQENLLTRVSALMLDGHFVIEHSARQAAQRCFNFNGTAGIWRKSCIAEAGGWSADTVTEDLDLSYRAQMLGWKFIYRNDHIAEAELPATMSAFRAQQHRWAKGSIQVGRKLVLPILRSPLSWQKKLEAMLHLSANLAFPATLALLLLLPFTRNKSLSEPLTMIIFCSTTLSVMGFYALSQQTLRQKLLSPLVLVLGLGMAWNQCKAVFSGLFSSDRHFERTPKSGSGPKVYTSPRQNTLPELMISVYCLVSIVQLTNTNLWQATPFLALVVAGNLWVVISCQQESQRS